MNYYVTTTENIKNNTQLPTGLVAGDVIETSGYYTSNDSGAGSFTIRAKETGEIADNMFTYSLNNNMIAELQTPNGFVNIDQLGAKGDGVIPVNYTHADASSLSSVNGNASDDINYLNAALARSGIQIVELTAGKNYVVGSTINCVGGCSISIDGDSVGSGETAKILQFQTGVVNTIALQNNATVHFKNIVIYGYPYNSVIGCTGGNVLQITNATIYSSEDGIRFYNANNRHRAEINKCRIFARYRALNCDSVVHSSFEELILAPSNNTLSTGISLSGDNKSNRFRNISISGHKQNERNGSGISSGTGNSGNLFENIHIDSVNTVIAPGSMNAVFDRLFATNWNYAIDEYHLFRRAEEFGF